MAKLILTEAEKKAATWAELDDEALGKVVKATMLKIKHIKIKHTSEEPKKVVFMAAAIILCSAAAEANADTLKQTIEGLTVKGKPMGNWIVTIRRAVPGENNK